MLRVLTSFLKLFRYLLKNSSLVHRALTRCFLAPILQPTEMQAAARALKLLIYDTEEDCTVF